MMKQRIKISYGSIVGSLFCLAALVYCAPAQGQSIDKRCYTVDETFYKFHDHKMYPYIKPIQHCYSNKDHPYRYSIVDIPVSLAVGTVRTPEFEPAAHWYWILLQVEKPLPTPQMICMMSTDDDSPGSWKDCPLNDRLLRADWTVLEDGKVASSGSSTTSAAGMFPRDYVFKFLGSFGVEAGNKCVVEVRFTKDGTPLNVADPHLIVTKIGDQ